MWFFVINPVFETFVTRRSSEFAGFCSAARVFTR
jgi:hypothetical protein